MRSSFEFLDTTSMGVGCPEIFLCHVPGTFQIEVECSVVILHIGLEIVLWIEDLCL